MPIDGQGGTVVKLVRPRANATRRLAIAAFLAILAVGSAVAGAAPASASTGIGVFVGYADSLRADASSFPTPWAGSPSTQFQGCLPAACEYDAGAVRIVNNSGSAVTVNAVAVHVDTCTYSGWAPTALLSGSELIITQLATGTATGCPGSGFMDTSDVGPGGSYYGGNCTPNGIQPTVDVTINGQTTTYTDAGQVLNTGGVDAATCPAGSNESIQWTAIGHAPCRGSLLNLAPPTQTHGVGTTATVVATFANGCGQPLQFVSVQFAVLSGPNVGRTGSGVTDIQGQASFSYTGVATGTDTLHATITNFIGTITSNQVTVTWIMFAPGGGAFVVGDLHYQNGASAYWWGAQWWKHDHLSTGLAPASFKGFENGNASPWCGQTWTTRPGNSSRPPKSVSGVMAVIVSSHITKSGPVISGNIVHIILVRTNPGYAPNPGHLGTGTIIGQVC
jgi:hypothetical protein